MFLLPPRLRLILTKGQKGPGPRAFRSEVETPELIGRAARSQEAGEEGDDPAGGRGQAQEFEIFPSDPAVRKDWFSLTVREREVVALVCMGYRNYEIADMLGVVYGTVQTYLQRIFDKFHLRSRKEIRAALESWSAEEWWRAHH